MKKLIIIVALLMLGGCGLTDRTAEADPQSIKQCAERHPPPPQANVERLGLLPVYYTQSAASDDAATHQWFADMDACTAQLRQSNAKAK